MKENMKQYLYFSAPWCGPCRMLGPMMERVNNTIPVQKVNVDENSELAQQYNVRNIPTVVLLQDGQEVKRIIGVKPESEYLNV
jgi:thioredoxin 1